ncbi:hypothetical protein L6164_012167 [Bauhinia variegata]|uniref:Uncharacterized protein n=1 Tax=Bauhinia variegata TaxID=167791 RepID=A0ACB9P892_BAUVA|nr:hypothetical protein L6164_012167 [Bauhinia variegata]
MNKKQSKIETQSKINVFCYYVFKFSSQRILKSPPLVGVIFVGATTVGHWLESYKPEPPLSATDRVIFAGATIVRPIFAVVTTLKPIFLLPGARGNLVKISPFL